jgi:hypothetical protein
VGFFDIGTSVTEKSDLPAQPQDFTPFPRIPHGQFVALETGPKGVPKAAK